MNNLTGFVSWSWISAPPGANRGTDGYNLETETSNPRPLNQRELKREKFFCVKFMKFSLKLHEENS